VLTTEEVAQIDALLAERLAARIAYETAEQVYTKARDALTEAQARLEKSLDAWHEFGSRAQSQTFTLDPLPGLHGSDASSIPETPT